MSINIENTETSQVQGKSSGGFGLNLSSGMEAAVTSALSRLMQILNQISNKELQQSLGMAKALQLSSEYSAQSTRENGSQQFTEALAQGIGGIFGSGISLGSIAYGALRNPYKQEFEQIKQEELGIHSYKEALPKQFNPNLDERRVLSRNSENAEQTEEVTNRFKALKDQKSFVDEKGKAIKASHKRAIESSQTDEELIKAMDENQVKELNDSLEMRKDSLEERKQKISEKQGDRQRIFSTVGQTVGQISSSGGSVVGAFAKKAQMEDQAESQLSSSASQGIQSIMSQILKTANDALSQAQQVVQTFATISNGNRFQG